MYRALILLFVLPTFASAQDLLICDSRGFVDLVEPQTLALKARHLGLGDVELLDQCLDRHAWLFRHDTQSLIRFDLTTGLKQVLTIGEDLIAAAALGDGGIAIVTTTNPLNFGRLTFLSAHLQLLASVPALPSMLDLCADEVGQLWLTLGGHDQPGALVKLSSEGAIAGYWRVGTWPHRVICHRDGVVWVHCQRSADLWRLDASLADNNLRRFQLSPEVEDFAVDFRGNLYLPRPLEGILERRDEHGQVFFVEPIPVRYGRLAVGSQGRLWLWSDELGHLQEWAAGRPGLALQLSATTTHFQARTGGHHFLRTAARQGDRDEDGSSNEEELTYGTDLYDPKSALDRIYSSSGFRPGFSANIEIQSLATPEALLLLAAAWAPAPATLNPLNLPLADDALFSWSLSPQFGGPVLALCDVQGRAHVRFEVPELGHLSGRKFWLAFLAFHELSNWTPMRVSPAFEMVIQ